MQQKMIQHLAARLALIGILFISAPALAQSSGATLITCDVTTNTACNSSSGAVPQTSLGIRSDVGSAAVPVDVYNQCRYIDNGGSNPIFAGFGSSNEWTQFLSYHPTSINLVHCSKPATAALGTALHVYAQATTSTGNLAPTGNNVRHDNGGYYITVDEPGYYRFPCSGGVNCSGGVQSFPASVSFTYTPPSAPAAAWTTTASESFTGLDSDSNSPSWKSGTISYTSSPESTCGSANNQPLTTAPTSTQLCGAGLASTLSATTTTGPWTWSCSTYANPVPSINCQTATLSACAAGTVSWTVGSTTCNGHIAGVANGLSAVATANTPSQPTGSATFDCSNGAYTLDPSQPSTCTPVPQSCSGNVSWTVGVNTCSGTIASTANGNSGTAVSTNGNTGSATFACNNGSFGSATNASCSPAPPASCSATTANWTSSNGLSCSGTLTQTPDGDTAIAVSTGTFTGQAQYTCSNGVFSAVGSPTCATLQKVFMSTCGTSTLVDTTSNYWGSSSDFASCVSNGSTCVSGVAGVNQGQSTAGYSGGQGLFCSSSTNWDFGGGNDSAPDGAVATFDLSHVLQGVSGAANVIVPFNGWIGVRTQSDANYVFSNYLTIGSATSQGPQSVAAGMNPPPTTTGEVFYIPDVNTSQLLVDSNAQNQGGFNSPCGTGQEGADYNFASPGTLVFVDRLTGAQNGSPCDSMQNQRYLYAIYNNSNKLLTVYGIAGSKWKAAYNGCVGGYHSSLYNGYCNGTVWGEVEVAVPATICGQYSVADTSDVLSRSFCTCGGKEIDTYRVWIYNAGNVCGAAPVASSATSGTCPIAKGIDSCTDQ